MGASSKRKGSTFERLVAACILKAAGKQFTKKDCYRTPMSGGHPYAGESDLIISKKLREYFPFVVECKHRKTWTESHVFKMTGDMKEFITQVLTAASKDKFSRAPLLIVRGHGSTYAMSPDLDEWLDEHGLSLEQTARLIFLDQAGAVWVMVLLSDMMKNLTQIVKKKVSVQRRVLER